MYTQYNRIHLFLFFFVHLQDSSVLIPDMTPRPSRLAPAHLSSLVSSFFSSYILPSGPSELFIGPQIYLCFFLICYFFYLENSSSPFYLQNPSSFLKTLIRYELFSRFSLDSHSHTRIELVILLCSHTLLLCLSHYIILV